MPWSEELDRVSTFASKITLTVPGGEPVLLRRDLLVGEDRELGSDEQLRGWIDDVLVLARALSPDEIATLRGKGASAFFAGN